MNTILPENEVTEFEDRVYLNPQIGLDESTSFIDNLRTTQGQQNQEIFQQTEKLGTDISSNLGGLTGGESYFTSRFQTPQTSSAVSNLRAAAQATALNQVLANEQAKWQKRYKDAYQAYQKRSLNPTTDPDGENVTTTTSGAVTVTTDPIAMSMYFKKFDEYIAQGYSPEEADARAKQDLGISGNASNMGNVTRKKSAIGGENAYIYTLPNGHTVLVNEDEYELIYDGSGYALKNKQTGETTPVGE